MIVPGDQDVDKAWVSVELEGNVVTDPLVYGLGRGVFLELIQQFLLQLHQGEQEAKASAIEDLQHPLLVLVTLCMNTKSLAQAHGMTLL